MPDEDDRPRPGDTPLPRVLEKLSVAELEGYIRWLEEEIARTRADIDRKTSATHAAAKLFKVSE